MPRRTKLEKYGALRRQIAGLIEGVDDPLARRTTAAAILHHKLPDVSWTGFYMLRGRRLIVDAYQGPVACIELPSGTGVCWAAIETGETILVPDVHAYPGHIACDSRTRSEIVVPLRPEEGMPPGVLDLDSHEGDRFDGADAVGLEGIVRLIQAPR